MRGRLQMVTPEVGAPGGCTYVAWYSVPAVRGRDRGESDGWSMRPSVLISVLYLSTAERRLRGRWGGPKMT